MSSSIPTLGYFGGRHLGNQIRLLLKYSGVQFNDKRYDFGPPTDPQCLRKYWLKDKYELDLDFHNFPYYIDEDFCNFEIFGSKTRFSGHR